MVTRKLHTSKLVYISLKIPFNLFINTTMLYFVSTILYINQYQTTNSSQLLFAKYQIKIPIFLLHRQKIKISNKTHRKRSRKEKKRRGKGNAIRHVSIFQLPMCFLDRENRSCDQPRAERPFVLHRLCSMTMSTPVRS